MASLLLSFFLVSADAAPATAAIVASRDFLPALQPLIEHRQRQGQRFVHIPSNGSAAQIKAALKHVAAAGELKHVLLVGDAEPGGRYSAQADSRTIPAHLTPAKVNVQFGSEPQIASDHWYADLDDDDLADVAIGRLPADTPAELSAIVGKILAYEKNTDFGPWRQRVNFVAGVGGFSPLLDGVIESATSKLLTSGIPAAYDTRMTYGNWRSPFCPDPRLFHAMTVARHNEGCLFWVYMGHGQSTELDQVSIPGERFHIFDVADCRQLQAQQTPPIAILLACYTTAFDQPQDCLAEALLKASGGPVAVYGGSRVTMPYGMGVMGTALMSEYFQKRPATLGEVILAAKRRMMRPLDDPEAPAGLTRILLDGAAAMLSPHHDQLEQERREHLHLFNLLGDPMLRLTHPGEIQLAAPREANPGERLRISGRCQVAGQGILELVCRRDSHKHEPPLRERFDPSDRALEGYQYVYEQALDRCWARWGVELPAGEFATEITVPGNCRGPCHVRLLVANDQAHALGSTNLYVTPAPVVETAQASGQSGR